MDQKTKTRTEWLSIEFYSKQYESRAARLYKRVYDKISIDSTNRDAILTLHIKESKFSLNELNELQECWYLFVENKLPEFMPVPMLVACKTS